MRLQLLGDARDAFKWDCLHWLVTETTAITRLLVVPMRCNDEKGGREGKVPSQRFCTRPEIVKFLADLRREPRSFQRIQQLGSLPGNRKFIVDLYQPSQCLGTGWSRAQYWQRLLHGGPVSTLIFLDPDTGFEPRSGSGEKHLRFGEAAAIIEALGDHSCLAVYHHRARGHPWDKVLQWVWFELPGAITARAIYGGDVALILLGAANALRQLSPAMESYVNCHHGLRIHGDSPS